MVRIAFLLMALSASIAVAAARTAVVDSPGTFACSSWAAWHEYTLASLTRKGAHMSKPCPIRLKGGTRVEVIEDDAGYGASLVESPSQNFMWDYRVFVA